MKINSFLFAISILMFAFVSCQDEVEVFDENLDTKNQIFTRNDEVQIQQGYPKVYYNEEEGVTYWSLEFFYFPNEEIEFEPDAYPNFIIEIVEVNCKNRSIVIEPEIVVYSGHLKPMENGSNRHFMEGSFEMNPDVVKCYALRITSPGAVSTILEWGAFKF